MAQRALSLSLRFTDLGAIGAIYVCIVETPIGYKSDDDEVITSDHHIIP